MAYVSLCNVDTAGGVIRDTHRVKMSIGGHPVALVGDAVDSHGKSPHSSAVMVEGSSKMTVGGIAVVLAGHRASCGHVATSGQSKFSVGS